MSPRKLQCKCGETDPANFYGHKRSACSACHKQDVMKRGAEKRSYAIALKGGRCVGCGYNKCSDAMEFHHLDPTVKDRNFGSLRGWSEKRIDKELEGCVLLCSNCHREVHAGIRSL